jgi:hypothetical protein
METAKPFNLVVSNQTTYYSIRYTLLLIQAQALGTGPPPATALIWAMLALLPNQVFTIMSNL